MKRSIFILSDGTGITAETLKNSLLTQFEGIEFEQFTYPYVNTIKKAKELVQKLQDSYKTEGKKPIVFATLVNAEIRELFQIDEILFLDFFQTFIDPIENELQICSTHTVGRMHGLQNYNNYMTRINAVNFSLAKDDGANEHDYTSADIILIGSSRSGKTPTCLYMALKFGIYAANHPFTEEDILEVQLPNFLRPHRKKLFGLTIEAERLHEIRQERRPNGKYASLKQCQFENREIEALFRKERIPYIDTTHRSIEEISTEILARTGIKRRLF